MPPYRHWNQAPHKGQQVPGKDITSKFSSNKGSQWTEWDLCFPESVAWTRLNRLGSQAQAWSWELGVEGVERGCEEWKWKCQSLRHVWLFVNPWTVAHQAPLSMKFSRQEYRSALPFPSPGDLPNPGIKPGSPSSQADSLPPGPPGNPLERGWPTSKSRGGIILSSSESEASQ